MKKIILILITLIGISLSVSAQSAGDYRSVASGNWSDATKWEVYDGSAWIGAISYPGQNPGAGAITVRAESQIKITGTVPHPVGSLNVQTETYTWELTGSLTFSSETAVNLTVSGDVVIEGVLRMENQNGAKTHTLIIGHSLSVGQVYYSELCYCHFVMGYIDAVNQDDKLSVIFNTTDPNCTINGPQEILFQDVTFNGLGIAVNTPINIYGTATFTSGVVRPNGFLCYGCNEANGGSIIPSAYGGSIIIRDGAVVTGASTASYVDGVIWKMGDDPFTFPVGAEGVYSPMTITAPVGPQELFGAGYVRANASSLGSISDPGLTSLSNCEYWTLNYAYDVYYPPPNLNSPVDVTVGWNAASGCGTSSYITNVSDVTLAHFGGIDYNYSWDNHNGIGTGTITNGSVTWHGLTTSGPLTLANLATGCIAPSGLTTTTITTNSATLNWSFVTGLVSYDVDYKDNYSNTWINVSTGTTLNSVNLSNLSPLGIYNWRVRANCSSAVSSYRQAQFTTLDCGTPTTLTTTNFSYNNVTLSWSAVSNAIHYNVEYKQSAAGLWTPVASGLTSVSYVLSGLSASTSYDWRVLATCSAGQGQYAASFFTTAPPPACVNAYEPNNVSSQARTIGIGITISAGISSSTDVDWFKVTTSNNSNTSLEVTLSNLPADYDLYVYNKNLKLLGSSATTGTSNEVVIYNSNARNATYYIKVVGKNGAYNTSQCYTLLAQALSSSGTASRASDPDNEITGDPNKELLYPNPASEFVHLGFSSTIEGSADVQIFNTAGQLIKQNAIKITKGYNEVKIAVNDIKQGMYLLRINKGELNMIRKFVIAR